MQSKLQKDKLEDTLCFYSTGFFIQSNYKALSMMAQFAQDNNKIFAFNFAAEYLYQTSKAEIIELIKYSDFIFCNKEEAKSCKKYMKDDLGFDEDKDDEMEELHAIARTISSFKKYN